MSQENVAAALRAIDAYNRRDVEALLEELDPEVDWHPALPVLLGVETESPVAAVIDGKNGKSVRIRTYLDPKEALEVAGLRE